jgi:hypothetical protein
MGTLRLEEDSKPGVDALALISNRERSRVGNTDRAHSKGMLDIQARSMQAEGNSHMQEDNRRMALDSRVGNTVVSSQPPRWKTRR